MKYVYRVTELDTGRFYIGSQCNGKTIGVDYFTSSSDKNFVGRFKKHTELFKIEILACFVEGSDCVLQENIFIKRYIGNPLCINKRYVIGKESQWSTCGVAPKLKGTHGTWRHTEEWKRRRSELCKGRKGVNIGKHWTDEQKTRMGRHSAGKHWYNDGVSNIRAFECPNGFCEGKLQRKHSVNPNSILGLQRYAKSRIGIKLSEETRIKMSLAHKKRFQNIKGVK